jgi:hypothetical protein
MKKKLVYLIAGLAILTGAQQAYAKYTLTFRNHTKETLRYFAEYSGFCAHDAGHLDPAPENGGVSDVDVDMKYCCLSTVSLIRDLPENRTDIVKKNIYQCGSLIVDINNFSDNGITVK